MPCAAQGATALEHQRGNRLLSHHLRAARGVAVLRPQDPPPERLHHPVQPEEGEVPQGRLLLEEAQGRQDHPRGPHEAEGARDGVSLRLLRPLVHRPHIPPPLLLAAAEPRHRAGALPERAGAGGLREALRAHPLLHQQRPQGVAEVVEGGAGDAAQTHVSRDKVDLQQRERDHGVLHRAAGAADPGEPPGQAPAPHPRLPLQHQPRQPGARPAPVQQHQAPHHLPQGGGPALPGPGPPRPAPPGRAQAGAGAGVG